MLILAAAAKPGDPAASADPAAPSAAKPKSVDEFPEEAGTAAQKAKEDPNAPKVQVKEKDPKKEYQLPRETRRRRRRRPPLPLPPPRSTSDPTGTEGQRRHERPSRPPKLVTAVTGRRPPHRPYDAGRARSPRPDGAGIERKLKAEFRSARSPTSSPHHRHPAGRHRSSAEHSLAFSTMVGGKETRRQGAWAVHESPSAAARSSSWSPRTRSPATRRDHGHFQRCLAAARQPGRRAAR